MPTSTKILKSLKLNIMKTLKSLFICLLLLTASAASADEDKFVPAIKKGLELLSNAQSPDQFQLAANHFERIASAETKEWLPLYYAAYANLNAGLTETDKTKQDALYDRALSQLKAAEEISKENSEILAMQGYVVLMKLAVDPMVRGMNMMPEGMALLQKAKTADPENPRVYLIEGQFKFYTPEAYGGGKAAAQPILQIGKEKYAVATRASDIVPQWGKQRLEELLRLCKE